MKRKDAELLATQYAKRRLEEGFTPEQAAWLAFDRHGAGLTVQARKRVLAECEKAAFPTQGGALAARLAA